ncbi:MAG: c-type cytochrome [Pseudomonadota bacterium]
MRRLMLTLGLCLMGAAAWVLPGQAADAQALYAKCQGCHGADGAKVALGVGRPLKGLSAQEAAKALEGYKAKTFGGAKKGLMESQASHLSPDDIQALAQYIAKF